MCRFIAQIDSVEEAQSLYPVPGLDADAARRLAGRRPANLHGLCFSTKPERPRRLLDQGAA